MDRQVPDLEMGVDVGSVSAKVVVMDLEGNILTDVYRRIHGRPVETTLSILEELSERFGRERLGQISLTGTAGKPMAAELGALFVNEIVAQARAEAEFHPEVRTIIEIGGEDSKLIELKEENGRVVIDDFAMNSICAAGTGSFLDQQANRLGVSIEEEFGRLAMKSVTVPRIAGRCTVFAKSDMIHLQQKATPDYDIIAGLCFALARNFKGNLGRGRAFKKPVAFQGGVAANQGVVRAFTEILELEPGELIIPEHFTAMGAIGVVLSRRDAGTDSPYAGTDALRELLRRKPATHRRPRLPAWQREEHRRDPSPATRRTEPLDVYVGIDVGSISTNVVAIDRERRVLAKSYLMTAGRPIEAVRDGLREVGGEIASFATVRGVGATGSGRYLTGDFVGADVVRNEITAQATAAVHIDPTVDTIFEIGGQDSKYISIDNGVVVDFQMNHVCAAGTGSFLEEQAEKLGINIKKEFGRLSLA
ncbi:MAG TPA: acyl-CoA dehydratase activase, partial [Planctomycetota bacterium]|nr:acyl-CoA dehydratase activase [Planctomycetota bacterium]